MKRETLELLLYLGTCLAASYLLVREFRAYLDALANRAASEGWADAWKRGADEHRLNRRAQLEMFGSRWATVAGRVGVVAIVVALSWFLLDMPFLAVLMITYMGWGLYATRNLSLTLNAVYARLLKRDRVTYLLLHAALWPVHVRRANAQSGNQ